jgi:8-oxo-dGTP pyrophosphatase MutT (NUDIX family)
MHTFRLLTAALRAYVDQWPSQAEIAAEFEIFLTSSADVFLREHATGHFTGSAWLVSADLRRVLLTHHRKLGRWLQLGGHADGDADLAQVTLREAQEESGLSGLVVEDAIFDLDRHRIPARANEPEHWHYDVRYIVRATRSETFATSEESLALAWKPIHAIADDQCADPALRRMAQKWLASQTAVS